MYVDTVLLLVLTTVGRTCALEELVVAGVGDGKRVDLEGRHVNRMWRVRACGLRLPGPLRDYKSPQLESAGCSVKQRASLSK